FSHFLFVLVGGFIVSYRYKLTKEKHVVLMDEIKRLKNGGSKKEVTPEARKVFEQLTGWEYEKTWGNNTVGYENLIKYKDNHETKHEVIV
ncbi:MFS transporter, partial [Paenibacillus sp. 28ISP30-2]|nr:MFS transporter [Paenibacillus sp. 28ISP30-2]